MEKHIVLCLLSFFFLFSTGVSGGKGYRGYQVLKVENVPEDTIELLTQLVEGYNDEWDPDDPSQLKISQFWQHPTPGRSADIMVASKKLKTFKGDLRKLGLKHTIMIRSVQNLINKGKGVSKKTPKQFGPVPGHNMTWDRYHSIDDFHSYFAYLEETYPNLFYTEVIGKSFENRSMIVAKICKDGCNDTRPAMWIDAGIHAEEWIAPATAMFIIREIVENNQAHPHLTEKLDWYILPSVNPDGYAFTRINDTNRLWRKTRSIYNSSQGCYGVDANRNYGYHWNEGGSSSYPCDDQYHGPSAFSEIEIQNLSKFFAKHVPNIKFANALHSYGEMVLLPWSYTNDSRPPGFDKLTEAANDGADAIANVHGRKFVVGCIPCILYPASGGSCDWYLGVGKAPYAYGMELRDTGKFGFLLPPDEIVSSGDEIWAFHETMGNLIIEEFMGADGLVANDFEMEIYSDDAEPSEVDPTA